MSLFKKPKRKVTKVYIHCSASEAPSANSVKTIREWHLARGFDDVGYHFFIIKNGGCQTGRPLEKIPAAQEGHNKDSIAICLHGLKEDLFTEQQFGTLRRLCLEINDAYDGAVTFHGHREVAAKECPVFDYKAVLQLDDEGKLGWQAPVENHG